MNQKELAEVMEKAAREFNKVNNVGRLDKVIYNDSRDNHLREICEKLGAPLDVMRKIVMYEFARC